MGLGVLASVELDVGLDVVADVELVGLDVVADIELELVGLDVVADVELVGLDVVADIELVGLDVGLVSRARCGVASLHGHCEVRQTVVWLARARCGSGCGRAHWRSGCMDTVGPRCGRARWRSGCGRARWRSHCMDTLGPVELLLMLLLLSLWGVRYRVPPPLSPPPTCGT